MYLDRYASEWFFLFLCVGSEHRCSLSLSHSMRPDPMRSDPIRSGAGDDYE